MYNAWYENDILHSDLQYEFWEIHYTQMYSAEFEEYIALRRTMRILKILWSKYLMQPNAQMQTNADYFYDVLALWANR